MTLAPLAGFVATARLDAIPAEVLADGRRQLLDAIGVILGGSASPPVRAMPAVAGPATVLGQARTANAAEAAWINGTAGVFLDLDSGQRASGSHPAIHVIPTALAVAEEVDATGAELLAAIIVGCETGARIGVSAGRLRPGMSPHGGWATIGAAAAAARLYGFDAATTLATFDVASSLTVMSSTSVHTAGANARHLQAGYGARNGILAARLVADGITGEPNGVAAVMGGFVTPSFNPRRATVDLGTCWEFLRGYYKPYSCSRFGHAAIDALLAIRADRFDAIESIGVVAYAGAAAMTTLHPEKPLAARFSLPHTLAAAWVLGHADPAAFDAAAIAHPAIRALRERVHLAEDADYTALAPAYRPATVTITYHDGEVRRVERLNASGEADDPDRDAWLARKFERLSGAPASIRERILAIEAEPSVRRFVADLPAGQE